MFSSACYQGNDARNHEGDANYIQQARSRRVAEMQEYQNRSEAKPCDGQYVPDEANRLPGEMIIAEQLGERLPEKPNQNVLLAQTGMDQADSYSENGGREHHLMK